MCVGSSDAQEPRPINPSFSHKRKLSAQEALSIHGQYIILVDSAPSLNKSITPHLDKYKCAFILGILKPAGRDKLYQKIPDEMGALLAQKKHMGKLLTQEEEWEVMRWKTRISAKYTVTNK